MHPDQPRPSKPDLIVEVTKLSEELRKTLAELADQTRDFKEILSKSDKAAGREPEVVSANDDLQRVLTRLNEIWDRARKPIIRLGKTSNYRELLSEFRYLSLRPSALEVLKFVEFLDVVLETDASPIPELSDSVEFQEPQKKPRGRPVEIPEERKAAALQLKRNGGTDLDAAKILYGKNQPSKRQCDNVYAILASYCRKYRIDWPLG